MDPALVLIVLIVLCLAGGVVLMWRCRPRPETRLAELADVVDLEPAERIARVEAWLGEAGRRRDERAAGLIVQGCAWLDDGCPERAARPFQIAYHVRPTYPIAMVLAFACMKVNRDTVDQLLAKVVETWDECRRPALGASRWERALLDACLNGADPPGSSALARVLSSLPSRTLRRQVEAALADRPFWAGPLLGEGDVYTDQGA